MAVSRTVVVFLVSAVFLITSDAASSGESSPYCVGVRGNQAVDGIVDLLPRYTMVEKTRVFQGAVTINQVQIFAGALLPFKVGLFTAGPDNKFILKQQSGPLTPSKLGQVEFDLSGGNELHAEAGDHLGWSWTEGGVIAYTEDADSTPVAGYAVEFLDESDEFSLSNEFNRVYAVSVSSCETFELSVTVDNTYALYVDGTRFASGFQWYKWHTYTLSRSAQVVAIKAINGVASAGIRAYSNPDIISTNLDKSEWKCIDADHSLGDDWTAVGYDDSSWPSAVSSGRKNPIPPGPNGTDYIWSSTVRNLAAVYCRGYIAPKECQFFVANYEPKKSSYLLDSEGAGTPKKLLSNLVFMPASDGKGNLFYTTKRYKSVYIYSDAGSTPVEAEIAKFQTETRAIAVDPQEEVVFVAAVQSGIFSFNYSGGHQRVISDLIFDFRTSLAANTFTKDLFFLDRNERCLYKINYQDLDNPSDEEIIYNEFPTFPRSLVIDYKANRMYVLMENAGFWSVNLSDLSDVGEMITSSKQATGAFGLTMCAGDIYYSDYRKKGVWRISPGATNGNERTKFNKAVLGSKTRGITVL